MSLLNFFYSKKNKLDFKHFFLSIPKKTNIFFDIGANIGEKTEEYLSLGKKVIAVEPQKKCQKILQEKFGENANVTVVKCGVGSRPGSATLFTSNRYNGFSSLYKDWQKGTKYAGFEKSEKIKLTTIESLIKKFGLPDFCKIDIEGFELEALKGLSSKIPFMSFEYHGNTINTTLLSMTLLKKIGFKRFNICENDSAPRNNKWKNYKDSIKNLKLKVKENNRIWGDIYAN